MGNQRGTVMLAMVYIGGVIILSQQLLSPVLTGVRKVIGKGAAPANRSTPEQAQNAGR